MRYVCFVATRSLSSTKGVPPGDLKESIDHNAEGKKYFSKLRADMVEQMRVIARRASGECASLKRHKSDSSRGA